MPRFVLAAELAGVRIDKALASLLPETSRATIQRWIAEGRVRVDGASCRPSDSAKPGSVVEVEPGPLPPSAAEPDASVPFGVLYEDEHLIVVDKPAGVVVHPARGNWHGTLVSGLLARPGFARAPSDPRDPAGALRPGIVHRIDKDTSGLLVIAKDEATREGLKAQLARHAVERMYVALTLGVPKLTRIDKPHGRDPRSRLRFTSRLPHGKRAITLIESVEPLAGRRAARVACRLETGRTHQIRVHLAEQAKTPILSDKLYGRRPADAEIAAAADAIGRQALHAGVLGFVHPKSGQTLRFEQPPPADFEAGLQCLRALG